MNVNLTFSKPTANNDGSPLDPASIQSYGVFGTVSSDGAESVPADVSPGAVPGFAEAVSITVANANAGDIVCIYLRTNVAGGISDPSTQSCVTVAHRPNPPTNLALTNA